MNTQISEVEYSITCYNMILDLGNVSKQTLGPPGPITELMYRPYIGVVST